MKARAPFEGSFLPEGRLKGQSSLDKLAGKNAKGVWQLVIHATRSDRFGMLHEWKLQFRPQSSMQGDQYLTSVVAQAAGDGEQATSFPTERQSSSDSRSKSDDRKRSEDRSRYGAQPDQQKREAAAQAWVNAAGPEQARKRQEQLDRYRAWAEKMKASGKEITAEGKKQFFPESGKKKSYSKEDFERLRKEKTRNKDYSKRR